MLTPQVNDIAASPATTAAGEVDSVVNENHATYILRSDADSALTLRYKPMESFFADSMLTQGVQTRAGVEGIPRPYNVKNDSFFSCILLLALLLFIVSLSASSSLITEKLKNFFRSKNSRDEEVEPVYETRMMSLALASGAIAFATFYYFYAIDTDIRFFTETWHQYVIYGVFLLLTVLFMQTKYILYSITDNVFFDTQKHKEWKSDITLINVIESVAIFTILCAMLYMHIELKIALLGVLFTVLIVKILAFYKCYQIFFKKISSLFQIILYLCTLEIVPLLTLWSILAIADDFLKIKF